MLLNRLMMFLSFGMMNVYAQGDDNLPHKSCTDDNKIDDNVYNVSATCVEHKTKTLENIYPTAVDSPNKNSDIKSSIRSLSLLSLIGYLLF